MKRLSHKEQDMKNRIPMSGLAAAPVALLLVFLGGNPAAKAARCQEISTVWTLSSTYVDGTTASRIYGDGLGSYVDGSGVTARIKSCSTNDAVLTMGNRQLMFNVQGALLSGQPPAWTAGGPFASTPPKVKSCSGSPCTLLNIGNILASGTAPRDQYYRLYTHLQSAFIAPEPDGIRYHLDMSSPTDTNARVVVDHYPAAGSTKESWVVYPETVSAASPSPQSSSLLSDDRSVDWGQFSVPFYLNISVK
jgi:hypothetical protein